MENKFIHTIKSIALCIKYPFLYPRNRFTGLHYTNWTLYNLLAKNNEKSLYNKAFIDSFIIIDNPKPDEQQFRATHNIKNYYYAALYYIVEFIYEYAIQIFHCIPTYTEWDTLKEEAPGWYAAFGEQFLKELGDAVKKLPKKDRRAFRITQIKEKYGELCVYANFGSNEIYDVIIKYEYLSYHTCINCGKPATKLTDGYILPYCDDCFSKYSPYSDVYSVMVNGEWATNQNEF